MSRFGGRVEVVFEGKGGREGGIEVVMGRLVEE